MQNTNSQPKTQEADITRMLIRALHAAIQREIKICHKEVVNTGAMQERIADLVERITKESM